MKMVSRFAFAGGLVFAALGFQLASGDDTKARVPEKAGLEATIEKVEVHWYRSRGKGSASQSD